MQTYSIASSEHDTSLLLGCTRFKPALLLGLPQHLRHALSQLANAVLAQLSPRLLRVALVHDVDTPQNGGIAAGLIVESGPITMRACGCVEQR